MASKVKPFQCLTRDCMSLVALNYPLPLRVYGSHNRTSNIYTSSSLTNVHSSNIPASFLAMCESYMIVESLHRERDNAYI